MGAAGQLVRPKANCPMGRIDAEKWQNCDKHVAVLLTIAGTEGARQSGAQRPTAGRQRRSRRTLGMPAQNGRLPAELMRFRRRRSLAGKALRACSTAWLSPQTISPTDQAWL